MWLESATETENSEPVVFKSDLSVHQYEQLKQYKKADAQ